MQSSDFQNRVQTGLEKILSERPNFHGADGTANWQIDRNLIDWLAANTKPGMTTLETGAGYSTVVFALCGAKHTAISPAPKEHQRIAEWCQTHDIPTDRITFIDKGSEAVLPALEPDPLDIVLIDGRHAFPAPFIDWYYTANRLNVGGHVIVDDIHLRACRILSDFLAAEKGRWKLKQRFLTVAIYEKVAEDIHVRNWSFQPWGVKKEHDLKAKCAIFKSKCKKRLLKCLGLRKES